MTLENALKIIFDSAEELGTPLHATTYRDSITHQKTEIRVCFDENEWTREKYRQVNSLFPTAKDGGSAKTHHRAILDFAEKIKADRKNRW